jgi:hypothetical protein
MSKANTSGRRASSSSSKSRSSHRHKVDTSNRSRSRATLATSTTSKSELGSRNRNGRRNGSLFGSSFKYRSCVRSVAPLKLSVVPSTPPTPIAAIHVSSSSSSSRISNGNGAVSNESDNDNIIEVSKRSRDSRDRRYVRNHRSTTNSLSSIPSPLQASVSSMNTTSMPIFSASPSTSSSTPTTTTLVSNGVPSSSQSSQPQRSLGVVYLPFVMSSASPPTVNAMVAAYNSVTPTAVGPSQLPLHNDLPFHSSLNDGHGAISTSMPNMMMPIIYPPSIQMGRYSSDQKASEASAQKRTTSSTQSLMHVPLPVQVQTPTHSNNSNITSNANNNNSSNSNNTSHHYNTIHHHHSHRARRSSSRHSSSRSRSHSRSKVQRLPPSRSSVVSTNNTNRKEFVKRSKLARVSKPKPVVTTSASTSTGAQLNESRPSQSVGLLNLTRTSSDGGTTVIAPANSSEMTSIPPTTADSSSSSASPFNSQSASSSSVERIVSHSSSINNSQPLVPVPPLSWILRAPSAVPIPTTPPSTSSTVGPLSLSTFVVPATRAPGSAVVGATVSTGIDKSSLLSSAPSSKRTKKRDRSMAPKLVGQLLSCIVKLIMKHCNS